MNPETLTAVVHVDSVERQHRGTTKVGWSNTYYPIFVGQELIEIAVELAFERGTKYQVGDRYKVTIEKINDERAMA